MIRAQRTLLEQCAENDVPVLVVEDATLPQTIPALQERLERVPRTRCFTKLEYDGFERPEVEKQLERWDASVLLLTGLYASHCVYRTARSARERGFGIATADALIADQAEGTAPGKRRAWYQENGIWVPNYRMYGEMLKKTNPLAQLDSRQFTPRDSPA